MKFTHLKIKNSYYLMTHLKDKVTKHLKKNKNKYLKKDYILSNSKKNDQN